jgi:ATP-dependent RNA helicase DeaD
VESYIHRIGRTGRAGGKGLAITLVAPKDRMYLEMIEKGINLSLERRTMEGNQARDSQASVQGNRQRKGSKTPQSNQSRGNRRSR